MVGSFCGGGVCLFGFVSFLMKGDGGEPRKHFHSGKSAV